MPPVHCHSKLTLYHVATALMMNEVGHLTSKIAALHRLPDILARLYAVEECIDRVRWLAVQCIHTYAHSESLAHLVVLYANQADCIDVTPKSISDEIEAFLLQILCQLLWSKNTCERRTETAHELVRLLCFAYIAPRLPLSQPSGMRIFEGPAVLPVLCLVHLDGLLSLIELLGDLIEILALGQCQPG